MDNKNNFNFCHSCLNPVVTSNAVCTEGYEVGNLVSKDLNILPKGFMVYHTIRPPIDVFFEFMCKINISHIIIWPQVGSQKSSGFQIFTGTKRPSLDSDNCFMNVGTGFLQDEPGILFYHRFQPSRENINDFACRRLISKSNCLVSVCSLQIRIMKTINSSVPALLKVEVWGSPSLSCSKDLQMKVRALWRQKDEQPAYLVKEERPSKVDVMRATAQALTSSDFDIPDDFLDSITCEIMVLPFTLPCGKVIDQTTLEKHESHEANWGRRPSDPFTGKFYTDASKPVFDVALKARIDKFLIDNSDLDIIKKVPRTLGSKRMRTTREVGENRVLENVPKLWLVEKAGCSANSEPINSVCEKQLSDIQCLENTRKKKKYTDRASSCTTLPEFISSTNTPDPSARVPSSHHEDLLNDSINAALKSALSSLPSFTNFSQSTKVPICKCQDCDEKEILYSLPCQHLLCRGCLSKKFKVKMCICSFCNSRFESKDPIRFHL